MKGILGSSFHELPPPSFLPILERKLFGGPGEKTPGPYHLFSFFPTQPNILQKSFSPYFLSKVFYPSYFTFKQTHPKRRGGGEVTLRVHFCFETTAQSHKIYPSPNQRNFPSIYPLKKINYQMDPKSQEHHLCNVCCIYYTPNSYQEFRYMTCHINTRLKIMEQSVIKYPQIRVKLSNHSYKIHQTKPLIIKSPNTIPNSFMNTKLTILRKHNKIVHQLTQLQKKSSIYGYNDLPLKKITLL